jgi:hypothetical protein
MLGLAWFAGVTAKHGDDRVELSQWAPELMFRSQWRHGSFWLGLRGAVAWLSVAATGRTALGASARTDASTAAAQLGVDIEHELAGGFRLTLGAEAEVRAVPRRFTVNGERVTGLARVSPRALLGFVYSP